MFRVDGHRARQYQVDWHRATHVGKIGIGLDGPVGLGGQKTIVHR
jgi:hypothetical protein